MLASDLQVSLPLVDRTTTALVAARLIAHKRLAALVIADDAGLPVAVVSATDVLRLLVPPYLLDDIALAGVLDEAGSDELWSEVTPRTIGELLDDDRVSVRDLPHVDSNDTLVELAVKLVDRRAQIAVVDGADKTPRFVTLPAVMDAILAVCGDSGASA